MTQHIIQVPDSAFDAGPSSKATGNLEDHRIPNLPPVAYYIPNFVSEHEEAYLLQKVGSLISGHLRADGQIGESPQPKWKTVGTGRRCVTACSEG